MAVFFNAVLITVAVILIKSAHSDDACPAKPDLSNTCNYTLGGPFDQHQRDCQHDVYMSLCTLTDADNYATDDIWDFMCTSAHYCMGCRYAYTHCYIPDDVMSHSCGDEALTTMLAWYDAFTMGGKFALCDMGNETVMDAVLKADCLAKPREAIDNCTFDLQNTFWEGFNSSTTLECSEMNTRIACYQDIVQQNCPVNVVNVFTKYFQGVVSMSPCVGHIPSVPDGTSGLFSSGLIILLSMTLLAISNYV